MWQRWLCFWVTVFTRSVQHVAEVKLRLEPSTIFSSWTYGFNFKLLHRLVLKISTSQTCVSGLQWDDNTPRTRSKNLSNLFHLSVSGSLEPIPASIGREAGYIQVASLSQARGEHANSAWAGKQDYISHIAPLSHIQWWLSSAPCCAHHWISDFRKGVTGNGMVLLDWSNRPFPLGSALFGGSTWYQVLFLDLLSWDSKWSEVIQKWRHATDWLVGGITR